MAATLMSEWEVCRGLIVWFLDYSLISQKYLPFAKLADSVFNFLYSLWLSYHVCLLGGGLEYTSR